MRKQPPEHEGDIVLGKLTTEHFVSYLDIRAKQRWFKPAFNLFNHGGTQIKFNASTGVVLTVLFAFWLTAVVAINKQEGLLITPIIWYAIVVTGILVLTKLIVYQNIRFIQHYIGYHSGALSIIVLVGFWASFVFTVFSAMAVAGRQGFAWLRCVLETTIILALWVVQVDAHATIYNHLLLISIVAVWCNLRVLAAMQASINKTHILEFIGLLVYAVLSVFFILFYNLLPLLDRFYYGFPDRDATVIYLLTLIVFLPSIYLFQELYIVHARRLIMIKLSKTKKT